VARTPGCDDLRVHTALWILALIATVTAASVLATRVGVPAPLLLVVVGIGASFLPFVEPFELSPELVLVGLLPPLLYAASIRTSLVDIRAVRRTIAGLAVGLVIVTTLVVGLVTWLLLPLPLAAAFAFGAVVSPPDAVAATSIARRIGLPRRVVTILEGESLLNDATALVALRTAIVALGGAVTAWGISLDFLWAAAGGVGIGVVIASALALVRRKIKDPLVDTTVSFMAPFLAYLPAEQLHASGVISVVTTGLVLGHKAPVIQDATSRLTERINWETIQFLLENTVFLLIGLQVRSILDSVGRSSLSTATIVEFCVGVLITVILIRPLWVFPVGRLLIIRPHNKIPARWSWRTSAIVSWAGMRGVVTLAAAFVLPATVPNAEILVLGAFVVTAGTLLIQGLSLPWLARRIGIRGPDAREDALQEATVLQAAVEAGRHELDRIVTDADDPEVVRILRTRGESRLNQVWERLGDTAGDEPPSEQYRRLRTAMLAAERAEVLRIRKEGEVDSDVLTGVMEALDVEESMIDRRESRAETDLERTLLTPRPAVSLCEDLDNAPADATPNSTQGCYDCLREGTRWVHLRLCLFCGNVGCCDSSERRHATRHFHDTGHPVMRSFEPGEAWRWCYVHEVLG
jgi:CPA1 family monovalent cation:H+ antiporter